jgi:hypothetical protein
VGDGIGRSRWSNPFVFMGELGNHDFVLKS